MGVSRLFYLVGSFLLSTAALGCAGSQATRPTTSPVYEAPLATEPVPVEQSQVAPAPAAAPASAPTPEVPPPPATPTPPEEAKPEEAEK